MERNKKCYGLTWILEGAALKSFQKFLWWNWNILDEIVKYPSRMVVQIVSSWWVVSTLSSANPSSILLPGETLPGFQDLYPLIDSQIEIIVPIEPQRRTNGTSGTGTSIKHLKAVPSKTKKAPKRGNFHSPLWSYLIGTIDYILAPTKHLENFRNIGPLFLREEFFRSERYSSFISDSQVVSWQAFGIKVL